MVEKRIEICFKILQELNVEKNLIHAHLGDITTVYMLGPL